MICRTRRSWPPAGLRRPLYRLASPPQRSRQQSRRFQPPPSPSTKPAVPPSATAPTRPQPSAERTAQHARPHSDGNPRTEGAAAAPKRTTTTRTELLFRKPLQGGRLLRRRPPTRMSVLKVPLLCRDWLAAMAALDQGNLPCSTGEGQLLRIAASLAEGSPVDLRDTLARLHASNTHLVALAVFRAAGHRP